MTQTINDKLLNYFAAGYSLLGVESHEEDRFLSKVLRPFAEAFNKTCADDKRITIFDWDVVAGISQYGSDGSVQVVQNTKDPVKAVLHIVGSVAQNCVLIMRDPHPAFSQAIFVRTLRWAAGALNVADKKLNRMIILQAPRLSLPIELQKDVQLIDFPRPDRNQLLTMLDEVIENTILPYFPKFSATDEEKDSVVEAAAGMCSNEFLNALTSCIIATKRIKSDLTFDTDFVKLVFEEKVVNLKSSFLEYVSDTPSFDDIGGMELAKQWALSRRRGFTAEARALNLPNPKGMFAGGPAGCGKSWLSRAIANEFGFPLFLLDIGRLFGSKVGESEAAVREVIRILESIGRAVVLIDEIDKHLSKAATTGGGDSGTSSRVFGTLLTWMAEKKCPVFFTATANNVDCLPDELMRKGRFDELFYVGYPSASERASILNALLVRRYKCESLDEVTVDSKLVSESLGFSGAELDVAIQNALYAMLDKKPARAAKNRSEDFTAVLLAAIKKMRTDKHSANTQPNEMYQSKGFQPASAAEKQGASKGRSLLA